MGMKIADINEPHVYRYSRVTLGAQKKGTATVVEKYERKNGWHIVVHDKRKNEVLTLRPAHFIQRFKIVKK
jgi:hypothetical protein